MSAPQSDVIDLLVGVAKGSRLDAIRAQRPEARENAQKSYLALFAPEFPGDVTGEERFCVATFVAALHRDAAALAYYRDGLARQNLRPTIAEALEAEIARSAGEISLPSSLSTGGTGLETCLRATVIGDSPVYGSFPVSIW